MSVLLLVLGILVAACGVIAIGFGIPLNEFTVGTALMAGGATALTGGFILIGLSAVVSELARLADGLGRVPSSARPRSELGEPAAPVVPASPVPPPIAVPGPRPPSSGVAGPLPRGRPELAGREPRPPAPQAPAPSPLPSSSSVDVSAAAIERLRSTIPRTESPRVEAPSAGYAEEAPLSPNGALAPSTGAGRPPVPPDASEPRVAPEERAGGAVEALKASRLDFLFRSRPARSPSQPENFENIWPTESRGPRNSAPAPVPAGADSPAAMDRPATAAPAAQGIHPPPVVAETQAASPILKSGVVDGMAYTLYADGSIEAKLPEGTVRFGSVAELRRHIESNS